MAKYSYIGQMIEIDLSRYGYEGYFADTLYKCDDQTGKSLITMFVTQKDEDGNITLLIPIQGSQYITADRADVRSNIVRIVEYMCRKKILDDYLPEEGDVDE